MGRSPWKSVSLVIIRPQSAHSPLKPTPTRGSPSTSAECSPKIGRAAGFAPLARTDLTADVGDTRAHHIGAGLLRGRAFPPCKPSATNLGDDHACCGGLDRGLSTTPAQRPCRRRRGLGLAITPKAR